MQDSDNTTNIVINESEEITVTNNSVNTLNITENLISITPNTALEFRDTNDSHSFKISMPNGLTANREWRMDLSAGFNSGEVMVMDDSNDCSVRKLDALSNEINNFDT